WSTYEHDVPAGYARQKAEFVRTALRELAPKAVLDLGCNTGVYSRLAAEAGARVVAVDSDAAVVGELYQRAHEHKLAVLPLVQDLTRPTPASGWRHREQSAFLDRCRQRFDTVFMLALVHHLTIRERLPVAEVAALASELTTGAVIVEYVPPDDPQAV